MSFVKYNPIRPSLSKFETAASDACAIPTMSDAERVSQLAKIFGKLESEIDATIGEVNSKKPVMKAKPNSLVVLRRIMDLRRIYTAILLTLEKKVDHLEAAALQILGITHPHQVGLVNLDTLGEILRTRGAQISPSEVCRKGGANPKIVKATIEIFSSLQIDIFEGQLSEPENVPDWVGDVPSWVAGKLKENGYDIARVFKFMIPKTHSAIAKVYGKSVDDVVPEPEPVFERDRDIILRLLVGEGIPAEEVANILCPASHADPYTAFNRRRNRAAAYRQG